MIIHRDTGTSRSIRVSLWSDEDMEFRLLTTERMALCSRYTVDFMSTTLFEYRSAMVFISSNKLALILCRESDWKRERVFAN